MKDGLFAEEAVEIRWRLEGEGTKEFKDHCDGNKSGLSSTHTTGEVCFLVLWESRIVAVAVEFTQPPFLEGKEFTNGLFEYFGSKPDGIVVAARYC